MYHQAVGVSQLSGESGDATDFEVYLLIGAVPANGYQPFGPAEQIDAFIGFDKMGIAPSIRFFDAGNVPTIRTDPGQIFAWAGKERAICIFKYLGRTVIEDDPIGFGVPTQIVVGCPISRQFGIGSCTDIDFINVSLFIFPSHISNAAAIGRPNRHGLGMVGIGQAAWGTIGVIHDVQAVEHSKGQFAAIG